MSFCFSFNKLFMNLILLFDKFLMNFILFFLVFLRAFLHTHYKFHLIFTCTPQSKSKVAHKILCLFLFQICNSCLHFYDSFHNSQLQTLVTTVQKFFWRGCIKILHLVTTIFEVSIQNIKKDSIGPNVLHFMLLHWKLCIIKVWVKLIFD